jgi:hypothetical protein
LLNSAVVKLRTDVADTHNDILDTKSDDKSQDSTISSHDMPNDANVQGEVDNLDPIPMAEGDMGINANIAIQKYR